MEHSVGNVYVASNTEKVIHPGLNIKNPSDSGAKLEWPLMHPFYQGKNKIFGVYFKLRVLYRPC